MKRIYQFNLEKNITDEGLEIRVELVPIEARDSGFKIDDKNLWELKPIDDEICDVAKLVSKELMECSKDFNSIQSDTISNSLCYISDRVKEDLEKNCVCFKQKRLTKVKR